MTSRSPNTRETLRINVDVFLA